MVSNLDSDILKSDQIIMRRFIIIAIIMLLGFIVLKQITIHKKDNEHK